MQGQPWSTASLAAASTTQTQLRDSKLSPAQHHAAVAASEAGEEDGKSLDSTEAQVPSSLNLFGEAIIPC